MFLVERCKAFIDKINDLLVMMTLDNAVAVLFGQSDDADG